MALTRTVICDEGHLYDAREPACPICGEGARAAPPAGDDISAAMTIQSEAIRMTPEAAFDDEDIGGATILSPASRSAAILRTEMEEMVSVDGGPADARTGSGVGPEHQISKLTCLDGPLAGTELLIDEERLYCIGSDPYNDLIVPHKAVGARHVLLDAQQTTVGLRVRAFDLDSAGGTWLNTLALNGRLCAPVYLRRGDIVHLGREVRVSVS